MTKWGNFSHSSGGLGRTREGPSSAAREVGEGSLEEGVRFIFTKERGDSIESLKGDEDPRLATESKT
jgi:hypothetical protein